jgi:hypothetical protein
VIASSSLRHSGLRLASLARQGLKKPVFKHMPREVLGGFMRAFFLLGLLSLSFITSKATALDACDENMFTRGICDSIEMFTYCVTGSYKCDENKYRAANMASALFYLGQIDSFAHNLVMSNRYSNEIKKMVQEKFTKEYKTGVVFTAVSQDDNYIILVNKLNRKVREIAEKIEAY